MKVFKFMYSKLVITLLILVIPLAAAGLGWNIYNLITFIGDGILRVVTYSLTVAITAALLVFIISVLAYGRYVIKDGKLYCYFGFIRTKTDISEIVRITHFMKSDKLVIYLKKAEYSVIVISPEEYGAFINELKNNNDKILVDTETEEDGCKK